MKKPKKLTITIERGDDGWMVASVKQMPGCASQGKTLRSVLLNIHDAIASVLEVSAPKMRAPGVSQYPTCRFPSPRSMR
jgi:predicted RNase H-like HicB family nuclease